MMDHAHSSTQGPSVRQFYEPAVDDYLALFQDYGINKAGGLENIIYYSPARKRGGGVLLDFLRKTLIPLVTPALLNFGSRVIDDVRQGVGAKSSLKRRGLQAIGEVLNRRGGLSKKREKKERR